MSGFDTKKTRLLLSVWTEGPYSDPVIVDELLAACSEIDRLRVTLTATENALREMKEAWLYPTRRRDEGMNTQPLPHRIGIDAAGYVWRDFGDPEGHLSMAPSNPDNEPTPLPIVWYELLPDAESLAETFHEWYERLAPCFGYETRLESRVAWDEVPETNQRLMVAVCNEVLSALSGGSGSSAADVDGTGHSPGDHESVGERQGRQPEPPLSGVCWLVERGQAVGHNPTVWLSVEGSWKWTTDPWEATRYGSKLAAQDVIDEHFTRLSAVSATAVEHHFDAPAAARVVVSADPPEEGT